MIYLGVIGGGPATLSYEGLTSAGGTSSTATHSSVPIGAQDADRTVGIIAHWISSSTTPRSLLSATIGGVTAAIHVQSGVSFSTSYQGVAVLSAPLALGTATTVVLSLDSGSVSYTVCVASYRIIGLVSNTARDTSATTEPSNVISHVQNIDVFEAGILLSGATLFPNSAAFTITGVGKDYASIAGNYTRVGGSLAVAADEANRAITYGRGGSVFTGAFAAASFR